MLLLFGAIRLNPWEASLTNRGFNDDGTIDDLPWASVFDPAANARALSAIQAEGFRAASRIVDRFVRAVESNSDGEASVRASDAAVTNGNAAANGDGAVDGIKEFERLTRAWWSMTGQFLLRSIPATAKTGSESVSLDIGDPGSKRWRELRCGRGSFGQLRGVAAQQGV